MEEKKRNKTRRGYTLIGVLGITVIAFLIFVSIAGATPYAYIANFDDNNVSVIDTTTNEVTATVPVGSNPFGVAVNPAGTKVYVASNYDGTVSVIDTATNKVTATVDLGSFSSGIAVTPDGKKVYVASWTSSPTVSVIDTTTNEVTATVPVGFFPHGVAVTPDGTKVYVTNQFDGTVSVIGTATNTVIATITVGLGNDLSSPHGVAVNPAGTKVYVTNYNGNSIIVIDIATNTVRPIVSEGINPCGVTVNPAGTKIYVTNHGSGNVSVIDTATEQVTATVNVGGFPNGVSVTPDGEKLYVTTQFNNPVSVIDTATNEVIAKVNVGSRPISFGQFIGPLPVQPVYPVANFSSNLTSGYAPLSVQFTDLSTNATKWNWDFGDGATSTDQNTTHTYSVAGTYMANLTVSNANGTNSKTATINVLPAPLKNPTITWNPPADITYGTALSSTQLNAVAKDPVTGNTINGTYDYTPAAGAVLNAGNSQNLHVDFTPEDTTNYNTISADVAINVIIPPPTINSIVVPLDPVPVGTSIETSADVTYLGDLSTLTAEWNWGDGSTSKSQISSNFETSHVYNSPGIYTVTFTITDAEGRSETKKALNYVVVYDPQGGFVTGGGWINSPAGAYVADKTLAGKATFGFVSKYQKGSTVPTGNTQFQFNVANLNFHSASYDWLVVAGSQAKFKGTGTINGEGNYGFMLSAVDGAIKGDNIDKFRIKIWDKDTVNEDIIYDNEIEAAEDAEPSTAISGGSIIIHEEK